MSIEVKTKTTGFGSPAETYVDKRLDLNDLIPLDIMTTYYFKYADYFFKSPETEAEVTLQQIKEINEELPLYSIFKIKELIDKLDNLIAGYYDCNGSLIISENELESDNFTGYYEDVYTYQFCYQFDNKFGW